MKRNLLKGIVLFGAIALSSCSATNHFGNAKYAVNNDDVYYTKAKAGDVFEYASTDNTNYSADDDYYYYGDYTSRLSRFANYSPFDYNDNFYYTYTPYNNGFGAGTGYNLDYYGNYTRTNNYNDTTNNGYNGIGYAYSPYDFGYDPYYYDGYDDYGYGDIYAAYLLGGGGGGGGSWRHHNHNFKSIVTATSTNPNARGIRTTQSPGVTRLANFPGRPLYSAADINGVAAKTGFVNGSGIMARSTRDNSNNNNNFRPAQQTQSYTPSSSNSSASSGSTSSSVSSGGGGRPARP